MLEIIQIPVRQDNYIYLIHEPLENKTAVIDPAVFQPVLEVLKQRGWSLNYIYNTHHHNDHIAANLELKALTHCQILGAQADQHRIPGIDKTLQQGDKIMLGNQVIQIIETPGHTSGHIIFYAKSDRLLFCGDTLFSMGCGRLFEGSAEQMWHSLQKIKSLDKATKIYCSHEYTQANGQFALSLEPSNQSLLQRIQQVKQLRADNKPTVPSTLEQELATNPFLRENSIELQQSIDCIGATAIEIFSQVRQLKDNF